MFVIGTSVYYKAISNCLLTFCIVVFVYTELNYFICCFLCCFCFVCVFKGRIVLFVNEELILLC
jgi:hypothetical protein